VHLAVEAGDFSLGVEHGDGVVVDPSSPALEERGHDDDLELARQLAERLRRRTRDRLGERETVVILGLTEVARAEELGQADEVGTAFGRHPHMLHGRREVGGRIDRTAHLHQTDVHDEILLAAATLHRPGLFLRGPRVATG
jgi:hypothetical protein